MARCAQETCRRWRPDLLVRRGSGVQIDNHWYCSRGCFHLSVQDRLERLVRPEGTLHRPPPRVRLGAMLMAGETRLSAGVVAEALDAQRLSGRRLGAELQEMGVIDGHQLQRALARQSGTKYLTAIDPAIARTGHGGLSREMVEALGLVPFASEPGTRIMKVAYMAPVPRVALAALRELTGWTPDPYLVNDETWPALVDAYGVSPSDGRVHTTAAPQNVEDTLARITEVAEGGHPAKMSHARLDSHVWVRVETTGMVEDLLMAVPESEEDPACQTAPTLH